MTSTVPAASPVPAPPGALRVEGGYAGTAAALQDLERAAGVLDRAGDEVRQVAGRTVRCAASLPPESVLRSPLTAARAEARLTEVVAAPGGLATRAVALEVVAEGLRTAARRYREAEATARAALELAERAVGIPATVALGGLIVQRAGTARLLEGLPVPPGVDPWRDELVDELGRSPAEALGQTLAEAPWATDLAVGGARTALDLAGGPPLSYRHEVRTLLVGAASLGWLTDRRPVQARPLPAVAGRFVPAPDGVADLLRDQQALSRCRPLDPPGCPDHGPARLRVLRVAAPDGAGAWVVELPGTQQWSPASGANPFDLGADVRLVGGEQTRLGRSVARALADAMAGAGVAPGDEPVMLTGHSQGGLLAAQLAATPAFRRRFRVTHVVAAGAPIGRTPVPGSVRVLALEHRQDPVPRLDGRADPDRARWVTVHRDLAGHIDEAWAAHDTRRYTRTARLVDRSQHSSLRHWRRHSARFLDGERARAWDYRLERTLRSATVERSIR